MTEIVTATDALAVASVVGTAFHELAVAQWLVPDPDQRAAILPANFHIMVEHAMEYGTVQMTEDGSAVAVWFDNAAQEPPPPPDYDERMVAACGERVDWFFALDAAFDAHHPHGKPHHHLAFLAVLPAQRNRGLGSVLLREHHAKLDAAGIPGYLEASGPKSRDLYLRHGYHVVDQEFYLPEDGPPLWPMWRDPA